MTTLRIGLLGGGTVGGGVATLLARNAKALEARVGAKLEIAKVLVRDATKSRVAELPASLVTTDPEAVLGAKDLDLVVEVMGGVDPARAYVTRALESGKSVVTANKMLLATCGPELLAKAKAKGVDLAFEGSVGGGIPVIRVLREAMASDRVERFRGIVNGTCNFVLTRMKNDGKDFDASVKEAQELGYAEADPTLDVGGHDAAHKLVVLAMLAFGVDLPEKTHVPTEGITAIEPIDHRFADRFGYTIKHLAIGRDHGDRVELRVHPTLVKKESTLANVGGVLNAIEIQGAALGPCLLSGRGAGDMPTAVSVVADIADVASAQVHGARGLATKAIGIAPRKLSPLADAVSRYYVRFQVFDKPGVLGRITGALGDARVSIEQMVQEGGGDASGRPVQVVLATHAAKRSDLDLALALIDKADFVAKPTRVLYIDE